MTGFLALIAPVLVLLGRHGEAALVRPRLPAFLVSSVGLGWPSLTANPLMALMLCSVTLSMTLEAPIFAVLAPEGSNAVSCAAAVQSVDEEVVVRRP